MKRALVSIGLVALGTTSGLTLQGADFSGLDSSKWWSASLSLRGYYDDNINTTSGSKQESYGFEVSPQVGLHLSSDQTDFIARYIYTTHYSDVIPAGTTDHFDQTHEIALNLKHTFSERYSLAVSDSFVIGQEPDFLRTGDTLGTFQRISGDNIRNAADITFTAQITPIFGLEAGYANSFFDYDASGATVNYYAPPFDSFVSGVTTSASGISDRIEQSVHLDTHWQLHPKTVLVLGYQFSDSDYTGDEKIQAIDMFGHFYMSDVRNSRSHYGYVGVNQTFSPKLMGSVRIGATYTDSYNDPADNSTVSPYALLNLTYNYAEGSSASIGFTHDRSANSRVSGTGTGYVHDSETSVVYGSIKQRITPKLYATLMGTFQNSTIYAPHTPQDGETDRYFQANLDLEYRFTQHFSMHAGYNYDNYCTDSAGSGYDRNRAYVGATIGY